MAEILKLGADQYMLKPKDGDLTTPEARRALGQPEPRRYTAAELLSREGYLRRLNNALGSNPVSSGRRGGRI